MVAAATAQQLTINLGWSRVVIVACDQALLYNFFIACRRAVAADLSGLENGQSSATTEILISRTADPIECVSTGPQ
jgi:hypothetical protein